MKQKQQYKQTYAKRTLTERTIVTSESLTENLQSYKITYLEKTEKYMDKVRIQSFDRPECNPRSLSFLNPEQLLLFIKNCINGYFYLKEQRIKENLQKPLSEYRTEVMLKDLLISIREEQLKRWGKNETKRRLL